MDDCSEKELVRNSGRIATALERIATLGEAGLALAMHFTNADVDAINAISQRLQLKTDALKNAIDSAEGKGQNP